MPSSSRRKAPTRGTAAAAAAPKAQAHVVVDVNERALWTPTFETALSLLVIPRVVSALINPIADCDETFNYWEPLHYLLHGFGLQTWEYSPAYALRSYLYLIAHYVVAKATAFGFFVGGSGVSKVLVFFGVRGALALASAYAEAWFYRASIAHFGRRTARYLLWLLLWNAGLFHASTAFLPSTFVMYLLMLLLASWMDKQHFVGVFWGIVAVLCGWPYVGVMFVPFMVDTLVSRGVGTSVAVGAVLGIAVLGAELGVNYYYYRKLVLPAWNIVQYNVLSDETDSTLYGTEPWSYYARNLALNFNVAAVLALPAALLLWLLPATATSPSRRLLFLSPLPIWLGIMVSQAHKEERFLFPVYPLLCLAAAVTLSAFVHRVQVAFKPGNAFATLLTATAVYGSLGIYSLVSVSRVASNVVNFAAPLKVYHHLHEHVLPTAAKSELLAKDAVPVNLCVGKEWYRFPTSFFLPTNATRLQFIKSSFSGLLPKPFEQHAQGTSITPSHMNNKNREEPTRYIPEDDCDYVVDLNLPHQQETKFWDLPEHWELVHAEPFLHAEASRSPYRSFYIPVLTPRNVQFAQYAVYKNKRSTPRN